MKNPLRKEPFEKLAATIKAEQEQETQNRRSTREQRDYMPSEELEDAETANTRRVSQVYRDRSAE
jgi:hypothetical protein